jgi:serine/threonine protein kinase
LAQALVDQGLLTAFQSEQLMLGKCRGFEIGKYRILERLGIGGMSLVYLCEDPIMARRVAVKVLPNARAQDVEYLKRFKREARVAGALDDPHIVRTFDVDHDGKVNFMVMEYVDGSLLFDIVQRFGPMDVTRAAHYIRQASLGLQHAHEAGMVHRDIKPSNLILERGGTLKILDMGLARNFMDESEEVLTRGVLGTPDYLAPEQSLDSHNVDIRADLYSLGCTFYYLLTGSPPFPEGTVAQKLLWHQTRPPTPVRSFRPEVPEGLAAIVHRLLAKDRTQRFQAPGELAVALQPFTKEPIPPPPVEEMPELSIAARGGSETATDLTDTDPVEPVAPVPAPPTAPRRAPTREPAPALINMPAARQAPGKAPPALQSTATKAPAAPPPRAPAAPAPQPPAAKGPAAAPAKAPAALAPKPAAKAPPKTPSPNAPAAAGKVAKPAAKVKAAAKPAARARRRWSWSWRVLIGLVLIAGSIGVAMLLRWLLTRQMNS